MISPLNWGLGHASRLVPIIKCLKESGHDIIIGGDGPSIDLLKNIFDDLSYIYIPSTTLVYGKKRSFSFIFYLSFIKFAFNVFKEHFALKKIISRHNIDVVISDNRLGLYNKKIKSIYITHQLNIFLKTNQKSKSPLATFAHRSYIKKYDYCLIPDVESDEYSLAGRLSANPKQLKTFYIGPISRFETKSVYDSTKAVYDFICILSGPEPQRTMFEDILVSRFSDSLYKVVIVRGLPNSRQIKQDTDKIKFINHSGDEELLNYINLSKKILCRSGYSTIMDLANIGRRAILIPTPEQPEQEYLALRLSQVHGFIKFSQNDLEDINLDSLNYEESWNFNNKKLLKEIINLCL